MNKIVLSSIVFFIILAGVGVYIMMGRTTQALNTASEKTVQAETSNTEGGKSLAELLATDITQECTFSHLEEKSEGLVRMDGKKLHGKFASEINGKMVMSHIVSDTAYVYMWMEGTTRGSKFAVTKLIDYSSQAPTGSVNISEKSNYDCHPWIVDEAVFEIPSDVAFTDYSHMLQIKATPTSNALMPSESTMGSQAQQCAVCENLTGNTKIQCKASFGCK